MSTAEATTTNTPETNDPLNTPDLNQAAADFSRLMPQIKALAGNLNGKGIARVFSAVMEFPLADKYPRFRNKVETELFMLSLHALGAKSIMTTAIMQNQQTMKEIEKQAIDSIVEEKLSEKEEDNGLEKTGVASQE